MALFKSRDKAITALAAAAQQAAADGRQVFTATIQRRASDYTQAVDFADAIEAVESEGWRLEHWAVYGGPHNAPYAYPVFRRR